MSAVLLIYDAMDGEWVQPKPEMLKYVYPEDPGQYIALPAAQHAELVALLGECRKYAMPHLDERLDRALAALSPEGKAGDA